MPESIVSITRQDEGAEPKGKDSLRSNYSSRTQTGGKQQGQDVKRQEMERVRDEGVKEQASAEERETPGSFPHLK